MYREISRGRIKNQQCGFETRRRKVYERERNGNPVVVSIITMDSFAIFIAKVENRRKHRILIDVIFDRSFPAEFPVPLTPRICFDTRTRDVRPLYPSTHRRDLINRNSKK